MAENLKDILSNLNGDTKQETLLKYLEGKLSKDEKHEVEKHLLEDEFENDAVEGLQIIEKQKMELMLEALNRNLKKKTQKKRTLREKHSLKPQWWLYFSLLALLLIIVLVYIYIHRSINQ